MFKTALKFIILLLFPFLCSCTGKAHLRVEESLQLAGNNRTELQKVLDTYSDNELLTDHYRAACYLIANMPGHYTLWNDFMSSYTKAIDSLYPEMPNTVKSVVYAIPQRDLELKREMYRLEDVETIKADWLISHIDNRIETWHTCPWLSPFTFEEFCEYLLPYRFANEPLIETRDESDLWWRKILFQINHYPSLSYNMDDLRGIQRTLVGFDDDRYVHQLQLPLLNEKHDFDCLEDCYYNLTMLRSAGIPCCIDYVSDWATRNGRHFWRVLIDDKMPGRQYPEYRYPIAAKVLRKTFSNLDCWESNLFTKDVTEKYIDVCDVEVHIPGHSGHDSLYLAIFNDLQWKPTVSAPIKHDKALFPKMGKGIAYLPCYVQGEDVIPADCPFCLQTDGNVKKFKPQQQFSDLTLYRKYPLNLNKISWSRNLVGCRIEAADQADFKPADTIAVIQIGNANLSWSTVPVGKSHRYWRIVTPRRLNIGELVFYGKDDSVLSGTPIYDLSNKSELITPAFDGNVLTYSNAQKWMGVDFDKPVWVDAIRYITRTDDNAINPGMVYELSYWDGDGEHVIAQKPAAADSITFQSVPKGALYWLKNMESGVEERPFSFENNRIIYW